MTTAGVIVLLLFVIVLLLCEKQEDRPRALGRMVLIGILGLALYYVGPLVCALVLLAVRPLVARVGWYWTVLIAINIPFVLYGLGYLVWAAWADARDRRDNRAIRAGSKEAFDKRVEAYKTTLNYDERKAIEATLRIRDGGRGYVSRGQGQ